MGRVIAIIPAAGRGLRMGREIDKPYVRIGDRPALAYTLDVFEQCPLIDGCMLVVEEARQSYCQTHVVDAFGYRKVSGLVAGGATRQASVYRGLQALDTDTEIVVVHDGARPCLDPEILAESVRQCRKHGAVLVAVPVKDTVKRVKDGVVTDTLDRSSLWLAQTPQTFPYHALREAHERARTDGYEGTDDTMLVERIGHRVTILHGDYDNIKLTTPEDLAVAEQIFRRRGVIE